MKKLLLIFSICFLLFVPPVGVSAKQDPALTVTILSPDGVSKGLPGREETISAEVTNNTGHAIDDVMLYITMCDLDKHMTVNLEDYSADKPITINSLQPGETTAVKLPIRLVYVDHFYLYVTSASPNLDHIYSSKPIPIEIVGNTLVSKFMVQVTAAGMPIAVILIITFILLNDRYKRAYALHNNE